MEYFDVVDKNRIPQNYTKERNSKLEFQEYNTGTEIWIINNNKILMSQRSLNKSHPGEWEVPGGCSQKGENTVQTLIREINEEIGLNIVENDISLIGTLLYKKQFVDIYKTTIEINLNDLKLQNEEINDVCFMSKEEFFEKAEKNEIVQSVFNRFQCIQSYLDLDW